MIDIENKQSCDRTTFGKLSEGQVFYSTSSTNGNFVRYGKVRLITIYDPYGKKRFNAVSLSWWNSLSYFHPNQTVYIPRKNNQNDSRILGGSK